ncbi:MAG: hypothetical protein M0036_04645 [Desulfobacteraceae bacterium]|nr:hypothetical protein [Desulfobacteraceae bacterium]
MSDATIRAALKARLDARGAGIGRVHDYERWTVQANDFLHLFQDPATRKVFGWEIVRTGVRVERVAMRRYKFIHRYVLRGYYGLSDADATEKTAHALADAIMLDLTLTRLTGTEKDLAPELRMDTRLFGHVLCHVAEITLPEVTEIIEREEDPAPDLTGIDIEYYLTPAIDTLTDAEDNIDL